MSTGKSNPYSQFVSVTNHKLSSYHTISATTATNIAISLLALVFTTHPAGISLLKVNNGNTRKISEICSKLTINTPEQRQWHHSSVFIVNFEHISHLVLLFLLLTLDM